MKDLSVHTQLRRMYVAISLIVVAEDANYPKKGIIKIIEGFPISLRVSQ